MVAKQPIAAWQDTDFATEARDVRSRTFVAHVRYASTGARTVANTHPFAQDGRLFAHNGAFAALDRLDERLRELDVMDLVQGQTDSERLFALITGETRAADGDVGAGLTTAVGWVAAELPVFALNLIVATDDRLWALRYPETHELWLLDRNADSGGGALDATSSRIHVRSDDLGSRPCVVIASERMDDDPLWRLLEPGELIAVGPDLDVTSSLPLPAAPRHRLTADQLGPAG